jgi:hypothetical protein
MSHYTGRLTYYDYRGNERERGTGRMGSRQGRTRQDGCIKEYRCRFGKPCFQREKDVDEGNHKTGDLLSRVASGNDLPVWSESHEAIVHRREPKSQ